MHRFNLRRLAVLAMLLTLLAGAALPAGAQPRAGGTLTIVQGAEPASLVSGVNTSTFIGTVSTKIHEGLLDYDFDFKPRPALAESWTVAPDGKTYTFKLRRGVTWHDGKPFTSADVKFSLEEIWKKLHPRGRVTFSKVTAVDTPDASTVVIHLSDPTPMMLSAFSSYESQVLPKHVYEGKDFTTHPALNAPIGTGPFVFKEWKKGDFIRLEKNPNYWDKGKPYLDSFRAIFMRDSAAQVAAVRGERAHIQFRGFTPKDRDNLVAALGSKITVQESPWDCILLVAINHEKKPFDDKRVRRALTLALDRYTGSKALSQIAIVKEVAGVQVPGTPYATSPADLAKVAGYWPDAEKSRAEAKRLLKEAGVPDGFSFTFKNRGIPMPYEPLGVWMIDQWRRIGLDVKQEVIEAAAYFGVIRKGDFETAMDFQCGYIVEPDLDMYKFTSTSRNPANYGRYSDPVLDKLYDQQSRTTNVAERKKIVREFEKRVLDEEAHYLMTLQWHRIIPQSSKMHGWTITPSHYLNNTLDTVWLSE
jgi:peptide/nickel transport system substrate-binding protein